MNRKYLEPVISLFIWVTTFKKIVTESMSLMKSLELSIGIEISWIVSTSEVCTWRTGYETIVPPLASVLIGWYHYHVGMVVIEYFEYHPSLEEHSRMHRKVALPSLWEQLAYFSVLESPLHHFCVHPCTPEEKQSEVLQGRSLWLLGSSCLIFVPKCIPPPI